MARDRADPRESNTTDCCGGVETIVLTCPFWRFDERGGGGGRAEREVGSGRKENWQCYTAVVLSALMCCSYVVILALDGGIML